MSIYLRHPGPAQLAALHTGSHSPTASHRSQICTTVTRFKGTGNDVRLSQPEALQSHIYAALVPCWEQPSARPGCETNMSQRNDILWAGGIYSFHMGHNGNNIMSIHNEKSPVSHMPAVNLGVSLDTSKPQERHNAYGRQDVAGSDGFRQQHVELRAARRGQRH